MFEDPKALTQEFWQDIHVWLRWFWIYVPVVATFAVTVLTAHGIIPSLVGTGHLPASANRLRIPLTVFAFAVFVAAVVLMVLVVNSSLDVRKFWDRFLI